MTTPPPSLVLPERVSDRPTARLLVVPHAGGGATAANRLRVAAPPDWLVAAVLFGGREGRFGDPPPADFAELVTDVVTAATALPDGGPLVLVGHCSGALVALEAARELSARSMPGVLVAVSRPAPSWPVDSLDAGTDDATFTADVLRVGGVHHEVAAMPEILELLLPALRADFAATDRPPSPDSAPSDWPVLVVRATADDSCPPESMAAWSGHAVTTELVSIHSGHFVLADNAAGLANAIETHLPALLRRSREDHRAGTA